MSEQSVETSIQTEFKADDDGKLSPQTSEDKFFGVKTEIKKEDTSDLEVEVVDGKNKAGPSGKRGKDQGGGWRK